MPPIKGAIVRFCSNGDSYGFHKGTPVVSAGEYMHWS